MNSVKDFDRQGPTVDGPEDIPVMRWGRCVWLQRRGVGWLFAAGTLAMSAEDLATWDIYMMNRMILSSSAHRLLETEVLLKNGVGTRYGLGVDVGQYGKRRQISHPGSVSGFTSFNLTLPDDRFAIVVLTNQDPVGAEGAISDGILNLFFPAESDEASLKLFRSVFLELQQGRLDRSLFTSNANAFFTDEVIQDFVTGLQSLGALQDFVQTSQSLRGGMVQRNYRMQCALKTVDLSTLTTSDGKIEAVLCVLNMKAAHSAVSI